MRTLLLLVLAPAMWAAEIDLFGEQSHYFAFTAFADGYPVAPGQVELFSLEFSSAPQVRLYDPQGHDLPWFEVFPGPFFGGFSEVTTYNAMLPQPGMYTLGLSSSCAGCFSRLGSNLDLAAVAGPPVHMPEPSTWLTVALALGLLSWLRSGWGPSWRAISRAPRPIVQHVLRQPRHVNRAT